MLREAFLCKDFNYVQNMASSINLSMAAIIHWVPHMCQEYLTLISSPVRKFSQHSLTNEAPPRGKWHSYFPYIVKVKQRFQITHPANTKASVIFTGLLLEYSPCSDSAWGNSSSHNQNSYRFLWLSSRKALLYLIDVYAVVRQMEVETNAEVKSPLPSPTR